MDTTPLLASATSTIMNAQQNAANAAQDIARFSLDSKEVGGSEIKPSLFASVVSLKEAETQAKAGVKIIQTEREVLGSLFNAIV